MTDPASVARRRVSVHEAGHAVAAVVLGATVRISALDAPEHPERAGHTALRSVPPGALAPITYAGPWAEARLRAGRRPTERELHAVLRGSGHLDEAALCASGQSVEARSVVPLVDRCWISVLAVADVIERRGAATHDDVCAALGLPDGDRGGLGSVTLAMIRSGAAPATFSVALGGP
ncbi:hypothetical protein [Tsukamurella sp. NPDC003166]|uniref:hypothetical protein n=1 Tax=Tsukamurella sp. NPDC003166 TaxID=3154444 RepID=UPI0033AD0F12